MKAHIFIIITLFLSGCASWPDEGQGGCAARSDQGLYPAAIAGRDPRHLLQGSDR